MVPIHLRNKAADALLLERLQLPVQHLAIYEDERHYLWTQEVRLDREKDGELAALHVGSEAPKEAVKPRELCPARITLQENLVIRMFGTLFRS